MYGLIWLIGLQEKMELEDIFILITAAICHDLDHPGYNNQYQVGSKQVSYLTAFDTIAISSDTSISVFSVFKWIAFLL